MKDRVIDESVSEEYLLLTYQLHNLRWILEITRKQISCINLILSFERDSVMDDVEEIEQP